jgi:hypothetical protein
MDLSSTAGVFENVIGFISPGVFVEARKVHRKDAQTYRIEGGKFTSCAQPTPRWSFSASSATLKVDDRIVAKNVLFKVKQVPALYIPIFAYPIQEDQRSTGILFPHFGYSEARGFNVGTGFFWAMGRSFDQTFYVDHYTDFGQGFGHEFRYALKAPSAGTFRSYLFRVEPSGQREYDLNWAATQNLPGKVVAKVNVAASIDLLFQEFIQDSLDLALRRTRSASLNLQRTIARHNVRLFADSMETFFPQGDVVNKRVNRHLPTFRVNLTPTKERRTGIVLAYEAAAENLMLGNQDRVDGYGRRTSTRACRGRSPRPSCRCRRRWRCASRAGERAWWTTCPWATPWTGATWRDAWRCAAPPSRASSTPPATSTPSASST